MKNVSKYFMNSQKDVELEESLFQFLYLLRNEFNRFLIFGGNLSYREFLKGFWA